jgi:hypothetical protein
LQTDNRLTSNSTGERVFVGVAQSFLGRLCAQCAQEKPPENGPEKLFLCDICWEHTTNTQEGEIVYLRSLLSIMRERIRAGEKRCRRMQDESDGLGRQRAYVLWSYLIHCHEKIVWQLARYGVLA